MSWKMDDNDQSLSPKEAPLFNFIDHHYFNFTYVRFVYEETNNFGLSLRSYKFAESYKEIERRLSNILIRESMTHRDTY